MNKKVSAAVITGAALLMLTACDLETQSKLPFGEKIIQNAAEKDPFYNQPEILSAKESEKQAKKALQSLYSKMDNSDTVAVETSLNYYIGDSKHPNADEPIAYEDFMQKYRHFNMHSNTEISVIPKKEWSAEALNQYGKPGDNNILLFSKYTGKEDEELSRLVVMTRAGDGKFYLREMINLHDKDKDSRLTSKLLNKYKYM